MEKKIVDCPYNGVNFRNIPGYEHNTKRCPYCGSTNTSICEKGKTEYNHNQVERTILTKEEAIEIFKKYIKKHFIINYYDAGSKLFERAWYSQHWPTYALRGPEYGNHCDRSSWMGDDLKLAFDWYLDAVGRDFGFAYGRGTGIEQRGEIEKLEKNLTSYAQELYDKKRKSERDSQEKREKKLIAQGQEILKTLIIGDVVLVKFREDGFTTRGFLVLEIEENFIGGFYLDRKTEAVHPEADEIEGFVYSDPKKSYCWVKSGKGEETIRGKYKWDGKTFIKTRTYETKLAKFIKCKVKNAIILKGK